MEMDWIQEIPELQSLMFTGPFFRSSAEINDKSLKEGRSDRSMSQMTSSMVTFMRPFALPGKKQKVTKLLSIIKFFFG
jgi:hypothetical protein